MRGKGKPMCLGLLDLRITPAYAGKSRRTSFQAAVLADHPRLCGEKFDQLFNIMRTIGSPPPMRGKAWQADSRNAGNRITPAYAGKSFPSSVMMLVLWDHPRLCGEKFTYTFRISKVSGSPPPMRGKACGGSGGGAYSRITPAYAGKRSRVTMV